MMTHVHPSDLAALELEGDVEQCCERFGIGRVQESLIGRRDDPFGVATAAPLTSESGQRHRRHEGGGDPFPGGVPNDDRHDAAAYIDVVPVAANEVGLALQGHETSTGHLGYV